MAGSRPYTLRYVQQNPLALLLPLRRHQQQVYRLGERVPPSGLDGHGPVWEAMSMVLGARGTLQARVNLQRDFHLMSIMASGTSAINGGFRAQLYDVKKRLRFADRGVQQALIAGVTNSPFFLREPYPFPESDAQIMVVVQNLETVANTIQLCFYGQVLRFNEPGARDFPGGPFATDRSGHNSQQGMRP